VLVLPDVIANAGGVTVSYFEWVQDFSSFFWDEDEINARLVRIMQEAFAGIWQVAQDHKVSLRTATFIVACKRILHTRELRGLYPVWKVSIPVPPTEHGYKYRAVYSVQGVRVVGFDNERGKGDHCHLDGKQHPYAFVSVDQLVEDFIAAVEARRTP
jgi:hypothetical protein